MTDLIKREDVLKVIHIELKAEAMKLKFNGFFNSFYKTIEKQINQLPSQNHILIKSIENVNKEKDIAINVNTDNILCKLCGQTENNHNLIHEFSCNKFEPQEEVKDKQKDDDAKKDYFRYLQEEEEAMERHR